MLSLKNIDKKESKKKGKKKIDRELPYFITVVTLLATSGIGPYYIFQKIREINLLPAVKVEADKILKRIDVLGMDPLTAMGKAKENPSSQSLGEFLGGYVSSIQTGGNVINYLKSKMTGAFDRYAEIEKQSISKVQALVESYMTLQIVVLAVYIISTAVGSNPLSGGSSTNDTSMQYLVLILTPLISVIFMIVSNNLGYSKIKELETKKILKFAVPCLAIALVLMVANIFPKANISAFIIGGALVASSLWPALKFRKIYAVSVAAESATPQILRDITEARKAGIGPEKCVIHACKRKDFNFFNTTANAIANKLEWGLPLRDIYETLEREIKNFQVLIIFRILFEVISSGGGNAQTLDSLAETSEKIHNIEKSKLDMLKPYVMIGFMLIGITGFMTLMVINSLGAVGEGNKLDALKNKQIIEEKNRTLERFAIATVIQSFFSGLFLGKITSGTYSGGFQYSIFLIIISLVSISLVQFSVLDINSLFAKS